MTNTGGPENPNPKTIGDPWHSRPLDVHRWSDHPHALRLAEAIWNENFQNLARADNAPGPKPKTTYRNQLKALLLDLYVAWLSDPELSIGVHMSSNEWDGNSRYNALHLTRKIPELVNRLNDVGLIDVNPGSYSGRGSNSNRTTRIRAAAPLIERFQANRLDQADIRQFDGQECIILKSSDDPADNARPIEYADTDVTNQMRQRLKSYNSLLQRTFIDIPTLEEDYVERGTDGAGRVLRVSTTPSRTFVRRIFSRGSWTRNGRFYGGWWQQVGKDVRRQIHINDQPTVEVDFKGMHVAMLSLEKDVTLEGDPYDLNKPLIPGLPMDGQRQVIKQLVLTAINARDRKSAFSAFRDGWSAGHMAKKMTNQDLEQLLTAFTEKHPHLTDSLCSDQGIRLMYLDSCIAARVLDLFTALNVPVLSIHDSFIIPYDHVDRLKGVMTNAAQMVLGHPLPFEAAGLGLDEITDWPDDQQQDFIKWRQVERCPGYLARRAAYEQGGRG